MALEEINKCMGLMRTMMTLTSILVETVMMRQPTTSKSYTALVLRKMGKLHFISLHMSL